MAKDNNKSTDDWLPAAQGVGPPDPSGSRTQAHVAEGSATAEGAREKSTVQCAPRTVDNWDLGGNN